METGPHSAVDRPIEKKRWSSRRIAGAAAVAALILLLGWGTVSSTVGRSAEVRIDQIRLGKVERGMYKDLIPLRATVEPVKMVYVDAVQGGSVAEVLVEEGNQVNAGDVLIRLENATFQLQVSSQETLIAEQLSNNSSLRLQLDQNLLTLRQRLNEINYSLISLQRQLERSKLLYTNNMVSPSAMDTLQDQFDHQTRQKALVENSIAEEQRLRGPQMAQLAESEVRLKADAKKVRATLDSLLVRSPIKGLLTSFKAEVGQIIPAGHRIGQVDNVDAFKLKAEVDEFYIARIEVGQKAKFTLDGGEYEMVIDKVYPQVNAGKFVVSLAFVGKPPPSARPGLRISTQLELGASTNSVLLPKGMFFQETGGRWVFVTDDKAKSAVRREIQTGRSNSDFIEVKGGLNEGEKVITSSYANFMNADEVSIKH